MAKLLTDAEYMRLCQQLTDQQYDCDIIDDYDIVNMEWIPAEPAIKKDIKIIPSGMIDLTYVKSEELKKQMLLSTNFKIGNFKIRINRYNGVPSQKGAQMTADLSIWEERHKTPNGVACRVDYPMLFSKDDRFSNCSWTKYFTNNNVAHNVPIEMVMDIFRWLQCSIKLSAFL